MMSQLVESLALSHELLMYKCNTNVLELKHCIMTFPWFSH